MGFLAGMKYMYVHAGDGRAFTFVACALSFQHVVCFHASASKGSTPPPYALLLRSGPYLCCSSTRLRIEFLRFTILFIPTIAVRHILLPDGIYQLLESRPNFCPNQAGPLPFALLYRSNAARFWRRVTTWRDVA